jgi:septum formation protein
MQRELEVILASQSPRRRHLLQSLGVRFESVSLNLDEDYPEDLPAGDVAAFLAEKKSKTFKGLTDNQLLITADTTVILDGEVINKPHNLKDAKYMLKRLSGRMHEVVSGVCLRTTAKEVVFSTFTEVFFNVLSHSDIDSYVDRCQPLDKAGAYGIQEWIGYVGVKSINGCYYNVMGLPLNDLNKHLKSFGYFTAP